MRRPRVGADATATGARTLALVPERSRVRFRVRSGPLPVTVAGRFTDMQGTLHCVRGEPVAVEGSVRAASIDTGLVARDRHLRSADFLGADLHPEITFSSREFRWVDAATWHVTGELRIGEATRTLGVIVSASWTEAGALTVHTRARLQRRVFGVAVHRLDAMMVGRHVDVVLDLVALPVGD